MLTIQKLYEHCEELIKNGQGDRMVLLCVNDKDFLFITMKQYMQKLKN